MNPGLPTLQGCYSLEHPVNPDFRNLLRCPQLSCWSSHGNSLTQRNTAPAYRLLTFCSFLAPPGYSLSHTSHFTGHVVGLALMFGSFLKFEFFRSRTFSPPESQRMQTSENMHIPVHGFRFCAGRCRDFRPNLLCRRWIIYYGDRPLGLASVFEIAVSAASCLMPVDRRVARRTG